jgi:hypothetical protein
MPKNTALAAKKPATMVFFLFMVCSCGECLMAGCISTCGCKPDVTGEGSL